MCLAPLQSFNVACKLQMLWVHGGECVRRTALRKSPLCIRETWTLCGNTYIWIVYVYTMSSISLFYSLLSDYLNSLHMRFACSVFPYLPSCPWDQIAPN